MTNSRVEDILIANKIGAGETPDPASAITALATSNAVHRGMVTDQVSSDITGAGFWARKSRGILSALSGVLSADFLGFFGFTGYNGTGYNLGGAISVVADENFDATHAGSHMDFYTASLGSTALTKRMTIGNDGSIRAKSGGNISLLNFQGNSAALTGNSADQTLFTYTLPGGTIGPGQGVRVTTAFQHTTGVASVNYRMTWGGTQVFSISDAGTSFVENTMLLFNQPGLTNSQLQIEFPWLDATSIVRSGSANGVSQDSTLNQAIAFTFNVANTDQVTPYFWMVELIQ